MKKNEIIMALEILLQASKKQEEGMKALYNAVLEDGDLEIPVSHDPVPEPVEEAAEPMHNEDGSVTMEGRFTEKELMEMKFNDLKKLASSLEIPASGTRSEITARLLAVKSDVTVEKGMEDTGDTVQEPGEPKVAKKTLQKKSVKKQEPEIPEKWITLAESAIKDMERDEIISALEDAEVDIPDDAKDLVPIVAKAFMEGKLEQDDEDESPEPDSSDDGEVDGESYFPMYDPLGVNDPKSGIPKARLKAMQDWQWKFLESYDKGDITLEEVTKDVTEMCTQDELDELGDDPKEDDIVCLYIETMKRHIDKEGTLHEGGDPYEIGADNYCCGHPLSEIDGDYVCEVCGTRYEG